MAVIWIKGLVLVLAEAIGAFSLWMGYELFYLGITDKADGGAQYGSMKFWLTGGGPGLFFAAFGACMVVFAVTRNLAFESETAGPESERTRVTSLSGADLEPQSEPRERWRTPKPKPARDSKIKTRRTVAKARK